MTRVLLSLMVAAGPAAAADPVDLLKYLPPQANAVAVVNVDKILTSPRAVADGWAKLDHTEYLAGAIPVHPSVERLVLAKQIHPAAPGQGPIVGVMPVKKPIVIPGLAKLVGGTETTVGGEPAVATPNGTLLLPLADQTLGVAYVPGKQEAAQWARFAKASATSPLSRYLNAAVNNFAGKHQIAVAVDIEDMFDQRLVAHEVGATTALVNVPEAAKAVEAFAAAARGVLFTADVTADGVAAQLRITSAAKVEPNAVKAFVLELLDRHGATLEDLPAATAKADENAVTLSFKVSDRELARVMSLMLPPLPPGADADAIKVTPAGVSTAATDRYMKGVLKVIDDLREQSKRAKDYTRTALWHDTAAARIEATSVLGVDPLAVEFGVGTASRLRAIGESLAGVPVQAAMLESQVYTLGYLPRTTVWSPYGGFRYNPWQSFGPTSVQTNLPEIRKKQAEVIQKDADNRAKLWASIDRKESDVRRELAAKAPTSPGKQ